MRQNCSVQGREVEVIHGMTMVFGMQLAVYHVAHFPRKHSVDLVHDLQSRFERVWVPAIYNNILSLLSFAVLSNFCLELFVEHLGFEDEIATRRFPDGPAVLSLIFRVFRDEFKVVSS